MRIYCLVFAVFVSMILSGCYTFKGYSISEELETFYVGNFKVNAPLAPPTINQTFQEALKIKVLRESQLEFSDREPDVIFNGTISGYDVRAVSPEPGERTALNRLEIRVSVDYTDSSDEENNWKNQFSFFQDFPSTQNLLDVQDELIEVILEQLLEDIFNKAFTNW